MRKFLHKLVLGTILGFGIQQINSQTYTGIPYTGTAISVPGSVGAAVKIELEDFDSGTTTGDGGVNTGVVYNVETKVGSYYDKSTADPGDNTTYRNTNVDLASGGSGTVISGVQGAEYQCYTVNFAKSGNYHLSVNYATGGNDKIFQIFIYKLDAFGAAAHRTAANYSGTDALGTTGGTGTYLNSEDSPTFSLDAGTYVVMARYASAGPSYDYVSITYDGITGATANTWDGSESTDWGNVDNWSAGLPDDTHNVTIPSGMPNDPLIVDATDASVNDLTIDASATLTLNSGSSLIVNGTSTTNGEVIYNRTISKDANIAYAWYSVSSPVSGETVAGLRANNSFANGTGGSRIGLATYKNDGTAWNYFTSSSTDAIASGTGLIVKLDNGSVTDDIIFKGAHTSGNIEPSISQSTNNFNFVGNPYAAYLNLGTFLTENSATNRLTEQTVWIWDEDKNGANMGGYVEKLLGTDATFDIAPGQGFFVSAGTAATNKVTFHQSNQSHKTNTFLRSEGRTEIKLSVKQNNLLHKTKVYYIDGTTTGFDNGFDGSIFGGVKYDLAIYTGLVSGNQEKKIGTQSLPNKDFESMVIPVGVKATAGSEITFSAEALNVPTGYNVYLEDRTNNTFTRLDEVNAEYKTTVSGATTEGRFFLHTRTSSALSLDSELLNGVSIYKTNNTNLRIVGLQNGKASVSIFNLLGETVMSSSFDASNVNDIALPKLETGVYIVQLNTEAGKLNKKIILE